MLRNIYKSQKHHWFRSWGILNDQVDNPKKCEKKLQDNCLSISIRNGFEIRECFGAGCASHQYAHINGFWSGNHFQINFWEVLGLSAAIVTGIRYSIEFKQLKRQEKKRTEKECQSRGTYLILNHLNKVSNLILEYGSFGNLKSKTFNLHALTQSYIQKHTQSCILPQVKVIYNSSNDSLVEFVSYEVTESPVKLDKDCPQGESLDSRTAGSDTCTSSFQFFLPDSSFQFTLDSLAPFSKLPAIAYEPQSIKLTETSFNSSLISGQLESLVHFLNNVLEDLVAEEKCNMAAVLARQGEFKKAIRIWNGIIDKLPFHGKSLYNLATCYENGLGFDRDVNKAKELYRRAADESHARSSYRLARIFLREWKHGSKSSLELYKKYLSKSASFGFIRAVGELQEFLTCEKMPNKCTSYSGNVTSKMNKNPSFLQAGPGNERGLTLHHEANRQVLPQDESNFGWISGSSMASSDKITIFSTYEV